MKKHSILGMTTGILLANMLFSTSSFADTPNQTILPDDMKVYYNTNSGLSYKPTSGGAEKNIPTSNEFKDAPGCYVACISKNAKHGIYPVGDNAFLAGQIRVKGHYADGYCIPTGFENTDVRTAKEYKDKCQETFPERCANGTCFVGTQTANWF